MVDGMQERLPHSAKIRLLWQGNEVVHVYVNVLQGVPYRGQGRVPRIPGLNHGAGTLLLSVCTRCGQQIGHIHVIQMTGRGVDKGGPKVLVCDAIDGFCARRERQGGC